MSRHRTLIRLSAALAGVALVWACGGDSPTAPPTPEPARPATVTVSPATADLTALGATVQLTAEVRDQNARVMAGATVTWSSGDTSVATVDASGLVTAVGNGTATITASAESASGSAVVTVTQSVATVEVSPSAETIAAVGNTLQLVAEAFDENGDAVAGIEFSWESSDVAIVTVGASGLVTGVAVGAATITASAGSGQGTAEITVMDLDRAALVALYNATDGPNWVDAENWLTDAPLGDWYGVDTDTSGRVVRLDLGGRWDNDAQEYIPHNLSGPIPTELGELASLTWLRLHSNSLTGPIPTELGSLADLEELNLGNNDLTGPIPTELGSLADLEELNLGYNDLTGPIPESFLNLEALEQFGFEGNADLCAPGTTDFVTWLEGIDETYGPYCNESDVGVLNLLYEISGGPDWMNSSGWLETPALDEWYGVTADPLGRVLTLDLTRNGLTGRLQADLAKLAEMSRLRLGDNTLSGRLPSSLTRLLLVELHYADTELCVPSDASFQTWLNGIPSHEGTGVECAPLSDRDILEILYEATGGPNWTNGNNWLTDAPVRDWYGVGTDGEGRVRSLWLGENNLQGPIPPELGSLANLTNLGLFYNDLSGPIPPELGNLSSVTYLDLASSALEGPIPPELGNLSSGASTSLALHWILQRPRRPDPAGTWQPLQPYAAVAL